MHWGIHFVDRGNYLPVYLRIHLFFVLWNCTLHIKLKIFYCLPSFSVILWNYTLPIPQLIGYSLDCLSRIGLRPARLDNLCDYPLQFGILAKVVPTHWGIHFVGRGNFLPVYLRIHLFKLVFFAQRCVVCQTARSHTTCIASLRSLPSRLALNKKSGARFIPQMLILYIY